MLNKNKYCLIYLSGVLIHLLYLFVLTRLSPVEEWQWGHADSHTYIEPALSFLHEHKFLAQGEPDSSRTVGYPFFLSIGFVLSEVTAIDWRVIIYFFQAFVLAFAYPATVHIGCKLFRLQFRWAVAATAMMALGGAFPSYVTAILSDALFATLLVCAVATGLVCLHSRNLFWLCLNVLLVAIAATIRPTLALFPFALLTLYSGYTLLEFSPLQTGIKTRILVMFLAALVSVQSACIRNWINHGVYTPSEHGSIVLYNYLAREVLFMKGGQYRFSEVSAKLESMSGGQFLGQRIALRKDEAFRVFREYPLATVAAMSYNTLLNMVEFHWNNTLFYLFRVSWYKDYADGSVLWSPIPYAAGLVFVLLYGIVYFGVFLFLLRIRKNRLYLSSIVFLLFPLLPSASNYQGGRFRLWLEPLIVLSAAAAIQDLWRQYKHGHAGGTLQASSMSE